MENLKLIKSNCKNSENCRTIIFFKKALNQPAENNKVYLYWVQDFQGHSGNEKADALAPKDALVGRCRKGAL